MKRSEINACIRQAKRFFAEHRFLLPEWAEWSAAEWAEKGPECDEIRHNALGWDITDFGKGDFRREGLTLITLRNGNPARDGKVYCEKIMLVGEGQTTPLHFHWKKTEDIINRGGGVLCMRLWQADEQDGCSDAPCTMQVDGVSVRIEAGAVFRLFPGQSITYTPRIYHTFWAEQGPCMVGEVSAVNDDAADNRFFEAPERYPEIEEDEAPEHLLCNEYPAAR